MRTTSLSHADAKARTALVVTRKVGESIECETAHGEVITIELAAARGGQVRLRCLAVPSTRIVRGELVMREVRRLAAQEKAAQEKAGESTTGAQRAPRGRTGGQQPGVLPVIDPAGQSQSAA